MKVLYAEDEVALSTAVVEIMKMEGFTVDAAFDGAEAWQFLQKNTYDVIVLDIMMPKMSGLEVLEKLRAAGMFTPVLLLTAKTETSDRIAGLSSGADDYLAKPFALGELIARVKAMVRRTTQYKTTNLSYENIELNLETNELKTASGSLRISARESELLALFIRQKGVAILADEIAKELWGENADGNAAALYVSYLQAKLKQIHSKVNIEEVGEKYCLREVRA